MKHSDYYEKIRCNSKYLMRNKKIFKYLLSACAVISIYNRNEKVDNPHLHKLTL